MPHEKNPLQELISTLKQERDSLALKMHLAKAEVKEEWNRLERKWDELAARYEPLKSATGQAAENVLASLKLVAEEIADGFKRIREKL